MKLRVLIPLFAAALSVCLGGPAGADEVVVLSAGGAHRTVVQVIEGPGGAEIALEEAARGLDVSFVRVGRDARVTLKSGGREVTLENGKSLFGVGGGQLRAMASPVRVVGDRTYVSPASAATVLGAALGQTALYRTAYHALVLGAYEAPRLRVSNVVSASSVDTTITLSKPVPYEVRREVNQVVVTFQADIMEGDFMSEGLPGRIVNAARFERTTPPRLVFELGDRFGAVRTAERNSQSLSLVFDTSVPGSSAMPPAGVERAPIRQGPTVKPIPNFQRPIVLVIDPGHGGGDVGAKGPKGRFEKDVTLALAQRLRAAATDSLAVQAYLTRDGDTDLALDERAAIANNFNADIFVSLHANGSRLQTASGTEVFFLSYTAVDDEARRIAAQEGAIPTPAGGPENDVGLILWDMAQAAQLTASSALATDVHTAIAKATLSRSRGVKQAPFRVLVGATMPAVLVEVGFITNPEEEKLLFSEAHQARITRAIIEGLRQFIATMRARP